MEAHTRLEEQKPDPEHFLADRPELSIGIRFAFSCVFEQCIVSVGLRGRAGGEQYK
jgi:hypothetical protein